MHRNNAKANAAFTMVEIALCLGIIAFALVAIIGIMPTGMQVQKDNREDTIVDVEGNTLLDAIRMGNTNSAAISNNYEWIQVYSNNVLISSNYAAGILPTWEIIGLLSAPKYEYPSPGVTNVFVTRAKFRANSGPIWTQSTNANLRALAFGYLVTSEVVQFAPVNQSVQAISNSITTNLFDVRLTLQWPVYTNNSGITTGAGKQSFRTMISGNLMPTNITFFNRIRSNSART
jgi:type II secretory pathway pseudopilin PulG